MAGYCGEDVRNRFEILNSSFRSGFLLDIVTEDLGNLEKFSTHTIKQEDLKKIYQDVMDLFIKNGYTNPTSLKTLMDLRDGNKVPKEILRYLGGELDVLNSEYLTKTMRSLNIGTYS